MFAKSLFDSVKNEYPNALFQFDDVDKKAHKLLPTAYSAEDDSGGEIKVVDKHTREIKNVMDCSLILRGIIDKIYICRLYASGNRIDGIKKWINAKYSEYSQ